VPVSQVWDEDQRLQQQQQPMANAGRQDDGPHNVQHPAPPGGNANVGEGIAGRQCSHCMVLVLFSMCGIAGGSLWALRALRAAH
jgi:hypothetical protein